ncbi:YqhA family protein [Hyphococcus sp.]|uniref:YqhA family protein n=1 Tax=Hyphococcus sp. TaxID=2038636 RepID=UPI003CCBC25F
MNFNHFEKNLFRITRLFTLIAVAASLGGALLMFYIGAESTYAAFAQQFTPAPEPVEGLPEDESTVVSLMVALDNFLIGVVLLFFSYGVYGLFVRPDFNSRDLGLPEWLHVEQIGQLKQTIAEVIIVVLFVLFLRVALQTFQGGAPSPTFESMAWFLLLPVSILLLAAALRLVELHPKQRGANPVANPVRQDAYEITSEPVKRAGERTE